MAYQRVIDYIQAYSHMREGSGGTAGYGDGNAIPHANIDQLRSMGSGRIEAIPRDLWDDSGFRGKGHEFPTAAEIRTWTTEGKIDGEADTDLLGVLLMISLGSWTTTTPSGATDTRDHAFKLQNPSDGLQLPSTTVVALHHADVGYYIYPGIVGEAVTIKGGKNQYVTYDCTLRGNGRRTAEASFSKPDFTPHRKLYDSVSVFKWGTPGSPTDYTSAVVSWEIAVNNSIILDQAYYPRGDNGLYTSGNPDRGMTAGRLLFGKRTVTPKFRVLMENDAARQAMEGGTAQEILITAQGEEIETNFNDKLTIQLKDVRFRGVKVGDEGELVAVDVEPLVQMPSSGLWADLLTVTLRNGLAAYGAVPGA
jgi:hypothetical protein